MATIQHKLLAEIDPVTDPVQELYTVILAVTLFHQGQELPILQGVLHAVANRINQLQGGVESNG